MNSPKFVLRNIALLIFSLSSFVAHAIPYTLDASSNIVTGGGLQWLQWDETDGMYYADALSHATTTTGYSDWQLASNTQMAALFNYVFDTPNFFSIVWDDVEDTSQSMSRPWTQSEISDDYDELYQLFGGTYEEYVSDLTGDTYNFAGAYFGDDVDKDGKINIAHAHNDWRQTPGPLGTIGQYHAARATISSDSYLLSSSQSVAYGWALVRPIQNSNVPEPAPISLLSLGLLSLVARRLRKS